MKVGRQLTACTERSTEKKATARLGEMGVRKYVLGQKISSIRVMISANYWHSLLHQNHCMASVPSIDAEGRARCDPRHTFSFWRTVARHSNVAYS
ncbi:hypothetical protein IE4872_PD01604 (plasmid) [Rhizobium gallicum]|uniref:Uncharacterized protein n=1 Tax=Rhizobium gallicum TaxID=56730 RepID=A0A1L5NW60_9HYPH|nr:hypothetical protein IE4872_PD01604 [Rhizobium gallicum]